MACTIDCTVFFAKALACQNIDHFNIPTSIPTIGLDPKLDTCLCQSGVLSSMHTCASCRASHSSDGVDVTNTFISACNLEFPGRNLALSSSGNPSVTTSASNRKLATGLPILVFAFLACVNIIAG